MRRILGCIILLWPEAQVRLVSLGLPSSQSLKAAYTESWSDTRLRAGIHTSPPDEAFSPINTRQTPDTGPSQLNPSSEPQLIDFLGAWGRSRSEESGSPKRPLSETWDQHSEIDEESNPDYNHREKRLKSQPASSTANLDLFQQYHRELLNLLNRVPPPTGLRFRHRTFPTIFRGSVTEKDLLPSLHVEGQTVPPSSDKTIILPSQDQMYHSRTPGQASFADETKEETPRQTERSPAQSSHNGAETIAIRPEVNVNSREDAIYLKDIEPTYWVWLYSLKLAITDLLYTEMITNHEKTLASFIGSLAIKLSSLNKRLPDSKTIVELTSRGSNNSVKEFAHLLWCINSRFIRYFKPTDLDYFVEQRSIQEWILNLLDRRRDSITWTQRPDTEVEGDLISLLKRALASRYTAPVYRTYERRSIKSSATISPNQILMTEAAINFLATYYKTKNPVKWQFLYPNDEDFVSSLTKLLNWDTDYLYVTKSRLKIDKEKESHGLTLFPWEKTLAWEALYAQGDEPVPFFDKRGLKTHRRVQKIARPPDDKWGAEYIPRKHSSLQDVPDNLWALISLFRNDYARHIEGPLILPDTQEMLVKLENWRSRELLDNDHLSKVYPALFQADNFHTQTRRMLNLIWSINSRLIENLGGKTNGVIFWKEQRQLQDEFYRLLTLSGGSGLHSKLYSQYPQRKNALEMQTRIIKALNYLDDRIIYKLKDRATEISRKEVVVTEAAVGVMMSYYWNCNPSKWLQVFEDEETFVSVLAQLEARLLSRRVFVQYKTVHIADIQQLSLLPWNEYFIATYENSAIIKKSIRGSSQTDVFGRIEEILE
ncbi:hypothetical protein MJO29_006704 [Puccinia striiformis f. sp. tritici]|uniref:Uncharacterized protein n=1 Tax=Puccinia striiformis TaxID=27350 RepID=A0A2S4V8J2_9BASI|nr:hypothetical protein Pst134EA_011905 [Puccinia striiformis f. sp. tritici]KAH9468280.1 hypothetical protein Pst134EA_011905 [Puccinia striiformis f. sp. tritici]KAI7958487.1 hypothetical protein MJO29_006704 [Puccinia striiformis f. sp. tritici]POW05817.1 hypothetical protein PSHT_10629 [Puccinia striiformis]